MTVTAAGCSFSLYDDWYNVLQSQGYNRKYNNWALFAVIFGTLGSSPGLVVHFMSHIGAYILAAVLALIGYFGLGF